MIPVLIGIFLGACLFAATISSAGRALQTRGVLRVAHGAVLVSILLAAAAVSLGWPGLALPLGGLLILSGGAALILESGAHRVLPAAPILFGAALLTGIPFVG